MKDYRSDIYRLMLAMNRCVGFYHKIAKENKVKENTLLLMDILGDGKQHSQKQICEDWMIPRTTLNTIVGECVKDGYIILLPQILFRFWNNMWSAFRKNRQISRDEEIEKR